MSFDKPTRNRLQSLVATCRRALQADIEDQLQSRYGMYRADERIQPIEELSALSFEDQDIAAQLRGLFDHYRAQEPHFTAAYDRLVHEIGFTSLNRLVALRLSEERGYIVECVRKALDSEGFRIYQLIVDDQLGTPFETYRFFLHLIFDEMAVDLHFLFDRSLPQGLVFPSEPVLRKVLTELSAADLVHLWKEDETIGWVYQFFNDPDERKRMREQSQAPRNSREMAVRNQFFTPRYVVEFLVDNTLGRTWVEMRQGRTGLKERCQYFLKRTDEVFLNPQAWGGGDQVEDTINELLSEPFDLPAEGDEDSWRRNFDRAWGLAHQVDGYRSPQWTDRENTPAHYARLEPGADPLCADDLTTQEILEAMYLRLRGDRMSDGPGSPDPARNPRLYEAANEVRRRYQESIKPDATKEELLAAPFFVPFRAEKDPRDLKILDPACGSGHFLLYAFDLLEVIYREAWHEPLESAPKFVGTGTSLREDYKSLDDLERSLPGLILANNLFGVDIDPRAAQISAVALWLRAQRAFQEAGLRNMADRPQITKMNFVVAEPMPGEADLKQEFLKGLRPRVVAQVAERVFDVMQLAGEVGVLLRVEQALAGTLADARKQWQAERETPEGLFPELANPRTKSLFDLSDIDDDAFWEIAEETILAALSRFSQEAEAKNPLRRRLFADDSARGFAFIDLCRSKFDVLLMNPPFGDVPSRCKDAISSVYPHASYDLLACFVDRAANLAQLGGRIGAITSRTPFFLSRLESWRTSLLKGPYRISTFADLGQGVLDAAMVETAAYVVSANDSSAQSIAFINALDSKEKASAVQRAVQLQDPDRLVQLNIANLLLVPGAPLSYWAPQQIRALFALPSFASMGGEVKQGLASGDDFRFLRLHWEVPVHESEQGRWRPFCKGGEYQRYYKEPELVLDWSERSQAIYKLRTSQRVVILTDSASQYIFKAALTYPQRTQKGFNVRQLPVGALFGAKGPGVYPPPGVDLYYALGVMNTKLFEYLLQMLTCFGSYNEGYVGKVPFPRLSQELETHLAQLVRHVVDIFQHNSQFDETSQLFKYRPLTESKYSDESSARLEEISLSIERLVGDAFAIDNIPGPITDIPLDDRLIEELELDATDNEASDSLSASSATAHSVRYLSYLAGVAFGRFDIRLSLREDESKIVRECFDPLPHVAPGILRVQDSDTTSNNRDYPIQIPSNGILVSCLDELRDKDSALDLVRAIGRAHDLIAGGTGTALDVVVESASGSPNELAYFHGGEFFREHLSLYSRSRRKAPLYWPLATESGSYVLWLYYPRLTAGTLYNAVEGYVRPKLLTVERQRDVLEAQIRSNPLASTKDRERLTVLRTFGQELVDLQAELLRVAALPYDPDLNDGVVINAAPLRKLFRYKPWAKELDEVWKKLEKGDYDWSRMAFHLWPDRVRAKCVKDRSLAIAHDLESICTAADPTKDRVEKGGRKKTEAALIGEEGA